MKTVVTTLVASATWAIVAVAGTGAASAVPIGAVNAPRGEAAAIDVRDGGGRRGGGFSGGGYRGGGYRGGSHRVYGNRGPSYRSSPRYVYRDRGGRRHNYYYGGHRRYRYPGYVYLDTPYFYYGAPYYYDQPYYYDSPCRWLRRRAVRTGSGYWWERYRRCLDRYEY